MIDRFGSPLSNSSGEELATRPATTISPKEVAWFTAIADSWWDPEGDFKPLHRLNPCRLSYVREHVIAHFGRDPQQIRPFDGLTLCDVGCGGGLISEPMTRMGFAVTGVDAGAENIDAARAHATAHNLAIDYRATTAEALAESGTQFDVVLALEIVEHVADLALLFRSLAQLIRPGGVLIVSTLNRTLKSFAMAKIGAEYVLRWLPAGTHDWRKFLKPSEIVRMIRRNGLETLDLTGMSYDPLSASWQLGKDLEVNYLMTARKAYHNAG